MIRDIRHRWLSMICCGTATTMAIVAAFAVIHSYTYMGIAAILLIVGICTADFRGPRDPK